ncbi:hypothetical protein M422DRAFT_259864 [Sphaerobolus stellatus SS14]|uniref:Uncharacterized protein n=1 Tax=Sphaerobolus stellatus (strain SS14) TaxID=990650 RepID=A0A0C9VJH1_SPHS4|nr:hypothetical protein M422DRAFT_259864 [Sphaerobolus stellatus SS14]
MAERHGQERGSANFLPRSFEPPQPLGNRRPALPQLQQKHGRQYSVQLNIGDRPLNYDEEEVQERIIPRIVVEDVDNPHEKFSEPPPVPAKNVSPIPRQQNLSSEEIFALQFGYALASPVSTLEQANNEEVALPTPSSPSTRLGPTKRRRTAFQEDFVEEGSLVVLPPPPLLRPASFWRNAKRTALHTPSLHLVRRSTFIAAGLTFDSPVYDLSAFAVESRITVGKTRGLGGSAAVPLGLGVFG